MAIANTPRCATLQTPQEILSDMVNGWLPLIQITATDYPAFAYLMFDTEEIFSDDNSKQIVLKFKNLGGEVAGLHTNDNDQIEWREKLRSFSKTTIAANVAASATVTVTNINLLQGIGANTDVTIVSTAAPFSATAPGFVLAQVDSVSGSTLTLRSTVTVNAGDQIFRGHNSRNYCDPISNSYTFRREGIYYSNPQSLQLSMRFRTQDLNKDRFMYYTGNGVQGYVNDLRREHRIGFMQELINATWFGRNIPTSNGNNEPPQTRGIITSIAEAEACTPGAQYIHDLTSCCGTTDDDLMIDTFINIMTSAIESGYYKDGVITIVMNNAQMGELMKMQASFTQYVGRTILNYDASNHEGMRNYAQLRVMGMTTEYGTVEFVLDQYLSDIMPVTPMMVFMPKSMIGTYQNKVTGLDSNMNVKELVNAGYPTLNMTDVSNYTNYVNGGDECYTYLGKAWFYNVMGGIYNGAWRIVYNMRHYRSCISGCGPTRLGASLAIATGDINLPPV